VGCGHGPRASEDRDMVGIRVSQPMIARNTYYVNNYSYRYYFGDSTPKGGCARKRKEDKDLTQRTQRRPSKLRVNRERKEGEPSRSAESQQSADRQVLARQASEK
jgi:hypothetical protein